MTSTLFYLVFRSAHNITGIISDLTSNQYIVDDSYTFLYMYSVISDSDKKNVENIIKAEFKYYHKMLGFSIQEINNILSYTHSLAISSSCNNLKDLYRELQDFYDNFQFP